MTYLPHLTEHLHHEVILYLAPILAAPGAQQAATISQNLAHDWCPAKEHANLELFVHLIRVLLGQNGLVPFRFLVMVIENPHEIGTPKVCRIQQPRQRACRMFRGAVHLEQPPIDVRCYLVALLGDVRVDTDIVLGVPLLTLRNSIQKVR